MSSISILVVVALTYLIVLSSRTIRNNPKISGAAFLVLTAHHVISFLHVIVGPLPTVDRDPVRFTLYAIGQREGMEHIPYANLLKWVCSWLGQQPLIACEVSNLFFAGALVLIVEIAVLLELTRYSRISLFVFGLPPSAMLNLSVPLRESAQVFWYLALLYSILSLRSRGISISILLLPASCFSLILLHNGLAAYVGLIVPVGLFWATRSRSMGAVVILVCALFASVFFSDRIMSHLSDNSRVVREWSKGNAIDYIEDYATNVNDSRTSFGVQLNLSSPGSAVSTGAITLFYYLFSPLPWQASGMLDLYGVGESLLRLCLFGYALKAITSPKNKYISEYRFMFIASILLEMIWAAGTANWGTAFRHRLVAYGAFVLLGAGGWATGRKEPAGAGEFPGDCRPGSVRLRRRELRELRERADAAGRNDNESLRERRQHRKGVRSNQS